MIFSAGYAQRPSGPDAALPNGTSLECISVNNNKTTTLSLIRPNGTGAPLMRSISSARLTARCLSRFPHFLLK